MAEPLTPDGLLAITKRHAVIAEWCRRERRKDPPDFAGHGHADRGALIDILRRVAPLLKVRYEHAPSNGRGPEGPDRWVCDVCGASAKTAGNGQGRAPVRWTDGETPGTPDLQLPPVQPICHAPDCPVPLLEVLRG